LLKFNIKPVLDAQMKMHYAEKASAQFELQACI